MEWWVQCGNCSSYTSPLASISIFLTSCGHFVCNYCLNKAPSPTTNPKSGNTGYCYDCKKPCSVVNLDQRDKLNPDIAFYFQDPSSLLQKVVEVDKFQSLHRDRRVENISRKRFIDDIVAARLIREKTEKYVPLLGKIQHILCSKYGINPGSINKQVNYRQEEIDEFIDELIKVRKQQEHKRALSALATQSSAMEIDQRSPSSQLSQRTPTPGRGGGEGEGGGGGRRPSPGDSRGSQNALFRAHVQSEMRGDNAVRYSPKTTPTGSNKPSPLLKSTRVQTPQMQQRPQPCVYPAASIQTPPPYQPPQVHSSMRPLVSNMQQGQYRGSYPPLSAPLHPPSVQMGAITPVGYRPPAVSNPGLGGIKNSLRRMPGPSLSQNINVRDGRPPHHGYPARASSQQSIPMLVSPVMTTRSTKVIPKSNQIEYRLPGSYLSSAAVRN